MIAASPAPCMSIAATQPPKQCFDEVMVTLQLIPAYENPKLLMAAYQLILLISA